MNIWIFLVQTFSLGGPFCYIRFMIIKNIKGQANGQFLWKKNYWKVTLFLKGGVIKKWPSVTKVTLFVDFPKASTSKKHFTLSFIDRWALMRMKWPITIFIHALQWLIGFDTKTTAPKLQHNTKAEDHGNIVVPWSKRSLLR